MPRISGNRSLKIDEDWEEQENRYKGGPLPNEGLRTGLAQREALGHDNGPVTKVELNVDGDGHDCERTNDGGRVF